jgi:recombination protein RecA
MTDLDKTADALNKRFGDLTVYKLGSSEDVKVQRIKTGSLGLDIATGGGVPRGRIIEIFGPESSGKTTVAMHIVAEAQKAGGTCSYIDMEHAVDPEYAARIGVNIDSLYFSQPDDGETALEVCEAMVRSGVDVVVVDSVAALVPRKELEGDMGDAVVGMQARMMSQALRKLSGVVSKAGTVVIFVNQLRMKIGQMFGNPETTSGGMALKFYASQRLDIRRIQNIKKGEEVIGARSRVRVVKNKVSPPLRVAEFDIIYNRGISREGEVIELGVSAGVISKRGAFYYYGDNKLGQGLENVRQGLFDNPVLCDELAAKISSSGVSLMVGDDPEL